MTPREVIVSALRIVGAIKTGEAPTGDMFEDAREALNNMLALWSAEELMPYDIAQTELDLFAGVPNYSINAGSDLDGNGVCLVQTPGGAGNLTINGALASGGVATLDVPRHIIITSSANDSGRTFTVTGTNSYGDSISEVITGPNTNTVRGYKQFKTVTQVAISGAATGNITVGSDWILNCRRPIQIVDAFVRDSSGIDWPVFPITHDRYTEIRDKDEVGAPTKFYYRRSYPSGEAYIHPVPDTGVVLTVNTEVEHIANGGFASSTGWTYGANWSVASGKLTKTSTASLTTYTFNTNAQGWTGSLGGGWLNHGVAGGVYYQPVNYGTFDFISPSLGLAPGQSYTITVTFIAVGMYPSYTQNKVTLKLGGTSGALSDPIVNDANTLPWLTVTQTIVAGSSNDYLRLTATQYLSGTTTAGVMIDNVSIELIGDIDTASQLAASLATALVTGDNYHLTFDVSGYTDGTCTPALGNSNGTPIIANGSYAMYITCGAGVDFDLDASIDFGASIDNISAINTPYDTLAPIDYQLFLDCWLPFVEFGPEDIDTEINLPGAYVMAMRWGLAVELAPDYGKDVSLFVYERSKSYLDTIRFSNTRLPKPTLINWPILTVNRQPAINRN